MRKVIYGEDDRFIRWAVERTGIEAFRADAHAIGLEDETGIRASVVFDGFSKCDCNMHVASDGTGTWMTREYLVRCFSYPFVQCRLRRVTGLVPAKNEAALKFDLHLGFRLEGRCRDALPDDDIIILGMRRSECIFIPKEYRT